MKKNSSLYPISVFILCAVITVKAATAYSQVDITGRRGDVDLSDIISHDKTQYNETELRKLCAEVTERYHSLGYTAFQIKNAVLKKDGRVELLFSDPVVESVAVTGTGTGNEKIASDLYVKGGVFNEFKLNENIRNVKKMYSVKRVIVDLKRNSNDNIDIFVKAEKRIWNAGISAASDPAYGAVSYASAEIGFNSSALSAAIESTAGVRDASYTTAGLNYLYDVPGGSISFLLGVKYGDCKDYIDGYEKSLYKQEYTEGRTGISLSYGAVKYFFTMVSSYSDYTDYSGINKGFTFTGASMEILYNDKEYRIDPLDEVTAEIKGDYGWNHIEEDPALRVKINCNLTLPVTGCCSLSAGVDSGYTSEDLRAFHNYVFDRALPARDKDYTSSPWRSVSRLGILFNIYGRFIYLSPEYIAALYKGCDGAESVHAAGIRALLKSELFSSEIAYTVEKDSSLKDGVMTFAAGAYF